MNNRETVLGTRGSALALAQTEIVCRALRLLEPSVAIRVERIMTTGDVRSDVPLSQLGRGIFVTEIESALRDGRIDFAVHSAKDLPSTLASDLTLAAFLPRADARDVVVSRHGTLRTLPLAARVGTSSPRRACQIRALRSDLELCDVRGNVDTRLRKLASGEFDALVLAAAGLARLGRSSDITEWLDTDAVIPSVGQGALVVEARADDAATVRLLRRLDDAPTRAAVVAERAFLAELGAGCRAAVGAYARIDGRQLRLVAMIGAPDGRQVRGIRVGPADRSETLGTSLARELLRGGGAAFLARTDSALAGKRVAITRQAEQSAELIALLRANGAHALSCPTIAIERLKETTEVDAALVDLGSVDWMVFTSANAVDAVADRLDARALRVPASTRLAAVGGATADLLARRLRPAEFLPKRWNAEALADELPDVQGQTILFPRGDLAGEVLPRRLRARGAVVRDVVVYRTVAGLGVRELASCMRNGTVDAVVFTSPSSVRFAAEVFTTGPQAAPDGRPAIVSIGPSTTRAMRELGLFRDAEAATQSVGGIVEALERCVTARNRAPALSPPAHV
jgi:hydroxymethylbilane synthase